MGSSDQPAPDAGPLPPDAPELPTDRADLEASDFGTLTDGGWYANLEYPDGHVGLEGEDISAAGWVFVDAYRYGEEGIVVRVEYLEADDE